MSGILSKNLNLQLPIYVKNVMPLLRPPPLSLVAPKFHYWALLVVSAVSTISAQYGSILIQLKIKMKCKILSRKD